MALYLVLLSTILAVSLSSTEQYVLSPGSNINLSLDSMKNSSGHWITKVDTRQYSKKENTQPLSVNVHQEANIETEHRVSGASASPSLHGYQLYPEFNCYKAFPSRSERRTWSEARDQCKRDGGDLMVMETERERQDVYLPLFNSVSWSSSPWVGVYKQDGWMTVNGEPALSTWWGPGYPDEDADRKCVFAVSNGLLGNFKCTAVGPFICEISL